MALEHAKTFSYPRKEKLKSKKLIEKLFQEGKSVSAYPLKLIYLRTNTFHDVRVKAGVAVPKKKVPKAINRNRIKRLLREVYRHNKYAVFNNTEGNFAFLILYLERELPLYEEVDAKMKVLFKKFNTQVHEKNNL
jgi:ribonuclease P protein component